MDKRVSIIIPCHNAVRWLPQCFLSLVNQTIGIEQIELLFVDDASDDEGATWELLTEFERAFPQSVIVIRLDENRRQGGARNAALAYATGEYVGFCDADDWLETRAVETVYNCAKRNDADIVQFKQLIFIDGRSVKPDEREEREELIEIYTKEERKEFLIGQKMTCGCTNKLYKRELLINAHVRFAEHVMYEEPLFVYPLFFWGERFVLLPEWLYFYRNNANGTTLKDMNDKGTLKQHPMVQRQLLQFMEQTIFWQDYQEEITLYFLHTYLYETLYFMKLRHFEDAEKIFLELMEHIREYCPECRGNQYLLRPGCELLHELVELCFVDEREGFAEIYGRLE